MSNVKTYSTTTEAFASLPADHPFDADGNPKVLVQIKGLRVFSVNNIEGEKVTTFELEGVKFRNREWDEALSALGYKDLDDAKRANLADMLSEVLFKHDIFELLADRIKVAG